MKASLFAALFGMFMGGLFGWFLHKILRDKGKVE